MAWLSCFSCLIRCPQVGFHQNSQYIEKDIMGLKHYYRISIELYTMKPDFVGYFNKLPPYDKSLHQEINTYLRYNYS